ncbi:MAG: PAS domain-containing protein [Armatimonadetes bacterium]|nr:PAS domain-containing protein [Armatimonadota bacterium]
MKVLVAEDDPILCPMLESMLVTWGYEVVTATDGQEAWELLRDKEAPRMAVIDWMMPRMDGLQICRRLRELHRRHYVYTILLTARASKEDLLKGIEAGADDYIVKPFDRNELRARLRAGERVLSLQAAMAEESERLAVTLRSIRDGVIVVDHEGKVILLSYVAEQLTGWSASEALGVSLGEIFNVIDESTRKKRYCPVRKVLITGKPVSPINHGILVSRQGKEIPVDYNCAAVRDTSGAITGVVLVFRDVTRQKRSEREMQNALALLDAVVSHLPLSVFLRNAKDRRIVLCNKASEIMLGRRTEDIIGRTIEHLFDKDQAEALSWIDSEVLASKKLVEVPAMTLDDPTNGSRVWHIYMSPIVDAYGEADYILCIGLDITERKRAERDREKSEIRLRHTQKMESIGQLAAGIAHEINTPTQYVGDNTRFLSDSFEDILKLLAKYAELVSAAKTGSLTPELVEETEALAREVDIDYLTSEIPTAINESLVGIERISKIVRAMKEFSHPGTDEKIPVDLNKAIETTVTVARNEWKYFAEVVLDLDPDLPLVPCIPDDFNQVILNLLVNAAHAIADVVGDGSVGKGTITISTRKSDGWAEIRVADTGTGIPESIRSKIFDPFFTTKQVGKGTGQGLSIAHAVIVDKHCGDISFESEVGKGTTFLIRIPIDYCAEKREAA